MRQQAWAAIAAMMLGISAAAADTLPPQTVAPEAPAAALRDGVYMLRFAPASEARTMTLEKSRVRDVDGRVTNRVQSFETVFAVGEDRLQLWNGEIVYVCRIGGAFQGKVLSQARDFPISDEPWSGRATSRLLAVSSATGLVDTDEFRQMTTGPLMVRDGTGCTGRTEMSYFSRIEMNYLDNTASLINSETIRQVPDVGPNCEGQQVTLFRQREMPRVSVRLLPHHYVGPVDAARCGLPPTRAVALNPYWTYPAGATAIDLSRIAREISAPGSAPGTNPSGLPLATALATDGAARVILGVRTTDLRNPVTFTLPASNRGGLRYLTGALFTEPATGLRSVTVQPSRFLAIPGVANAKAAAVVYVAPETPVDMSGPISQSISIRQGSRSDALPLTLEPPPVLLLHGIWSDSSIWSDWDLQFPAAPFPHVAKGNFPSSLSFSDARVQAALQNDLQTALDATRRQGTVAAQVDVVGYSLGGLAARAYRKAPPAGRSLRNFGKGDINRLVTIDTPHAGSPLASVLARHSRDSIRSVTGTAPSLFLYDAWLDLATVADAMAIMKKPVSGAVASLAPGSQSLRWLGAAGAPYDAIAAYDTDAAGSGGEKLLNRILANIREPSIDRLLTARNDVIVSLASQSQGSRTVRTFPGYVHSDLPDAQPSVLRGQPVMNHVACLLLNKRQCPAASSGEPLAARPPVDTFSLSGLRRVDASNLVMDMEPPAGGLRLGQDFSFSFAGNGRTLTHAVYLMTGGVDTVMASDASGPAVTVTPVRATPVTIRAVAAFSDRTYAFRTFTLPVASNAMPLALFAEPDELRMIGIGSTAQMKIAAVLDAPDTGVIDVTNAATYSIWSGGSFVQVAPGGRLTARRAGTATVKAVYRGKEARVTVRVVP